MRKRRIVATVGCAALLGGAVAADAGGPRDRATGGGQVLVASDGTGPGSTIAFTGQQTADGARGQVQIVDRAAGTGQSQVKFHGVVDCVRVDGNTAKIGGTGRGGARFTVIAVDNGEGAASAGDLIFFDYRTADPTCEVDDDDDDNLEALARGNVQVHDAP